VRYLASKSGVTLKTGLGFVSRSLKMAPFDRSHTSSYSPSIVTNYYNGKAKHLIMGIGRVVLRRQNTFVGGKCALPSALL